MSPIKKQKTEGDIKGQTHKVLDLAGYQTGSIVSREIISQKTGTVTIFAFDKGQQLSEHTAPYDAMVLCVDGEADVTISGQAHRIQKGEMIIMPANQPHALKALKKFKMLLIMIRS
jgi:quercetin dioxygenase-like cupin family protein